MTKDNERLVRETAEKLRAILFSVNGHNPEDYSDLRAAVLAAAEFCRHCGADERGNQMRCMCENGL